MKYVSAITPSDRKARLVRARRVGLCGKRTRGGRETLSSTTEREMERDENVRTRQLYIYPTLSKRKACGSLTYLILDTRFRQLISANCACVCTNIPRPHRDSVPRLELESRTRLCRKDGRFFCTRRKTRYCEKYGESGRIYYVFFLRKNDVLREDTSVDLFFSRARTSRRASHLRAKNGRRPSPISLENKTDKKKRTRRCPRHITTFRCTSTV